MLKTVDFDVLVLSFAYCNRLIANGVESFIVELGVGNNINFHNIIEIFNCLQSKALPFLHSFT